MSGRTKGERALEYAKQAQAYADGRDPERPAVMVKILSLLAMAVVTIAHAVIALEDKARSMAEEEC